MKLSSSDQPPIPARISALHDTPARHSSAGQLPLATLRALMDRIDWNLRYAAQSPDHHFSLLMVGVDRLWVYADCVGAEAADQLLISVADAIARGLGLVRVSGDHSESTPGDRHQPRAIICHMGGDVLAVLLEEQESPQDGARIARQICHGLHRLAPLLDPDTFATATVGVAAIHGGRSNQLSADQVVKDAEAAMHHARQRGRGWSCVFQPGLRDIAANQLKLECDLRRALNQGELSLAYQPIITLDTGILTGFEALIRWRKSDGTSVSPADFMPLAEETGLIWPIGEFVLNEACRQIATWRQSRELTMNINVSRRQFAEEGLADLVSSVIQKHSLPEKSVILEITESSLLTDTATAIAAMHRLKDAGIELSLDDFGTGYSSLSSLHQFPLKGLKIDRSFVVNASGNRDYAAILDAIIVLADNLGMTVVAEGIETHDQLVLLQGLGCPKGQGYLIGRPLPAEQAEAWITNPPSIVRA